MKFSKSTGCFYPNHISYKDLPDDLVEVSQDDFHAAMNRTPECVLEVVNDRVVIVPKPLPSSAEIKADKWVRIKLERDHRTENGGYRIGSQWFHSDQKSRSQQLGLVLLGKNVPSNLQWKTMDGSFAVMTLDLAQQVITASRVSDQAIFDAAEEHRAAMEACTDPVDYDFSVGWPKMFGE